MPEAEDAVLDEKRPFTGWTVHGLTRARGRLAEVMKRFLLGFLGLFLGCASTSPERLDAVSGVHSYAPGPGKVDDDQPGNPNTRDLRESGEPGTRYGTINDIPQPRSPDEKRTIMQPGESVDTLPVRVNGLFLEPSVNGGIPARDDGETPDSAR